MTTYAFLHFSQYLASSLVSDALRASLLLSAVALALRLLPRMKATSRSMIWSAVLLVIAVLSVREFLPATQNVHGLAAGHTIRVAPAWTAALAVLWLSLALVRGCRLLLNVIHLRALWLAAEPVPGVARLAVPLPFGRSRSAVLCTSADVQRPSVIGFFSPRILIPAALLATLSASEMDQIVMHEMEHLRRGDDWRNLLQKLALVLFPLNPALLWIDRRLAFERELACDEKVLEATSAPKSYASCLVHLAEQSSLARQVSLALGAWERRSELARRVHSILSYRSVPRRRAGLSAALVIASLMAAFAGLSRTPHLVSFVTPSPLLQVAAEPALVAPAAMVGNARQVADPSRPRVIEAVAHMPGPGPIKRVKARACSGKGTRSGGTVPRRGSPRMSARSEQAPYVLTSWVVTYDDEDSTRPRVVVTVFDMRVSPAVVPTSSTGSLPRAGSFLLLQL